MAHLSIKLFCFGNAQIHHWCHPIRRSISARTICDNKPTYKLVWTSWFSHFSHTAENGRHFADYIFRCIFGNEMFCISFRISLKFVPMCPIDNNTTLVLIMAWRRICWINADPIHWRIYAALGGDELYNLDVVCLAHNRQQCSKAYRKYLHFELCLYKIWYKYTFYIDLNMNLNLSKLNCLCVMAL